MSFEPHNLCVTGGAGFIGANFVRHWLSRSREGRVVVLDALTYAGNPDESRRARSAIRATCSCAGTSATRARCASCSSGIASTPSCTSPRNRTSTARSSDRTISSAPMWSARMRCSRPRRRCGSTRKTVPATSLPPRLDGRGLRLARARTMRRSTSRRPYAPNSPYSASKAASDHLVRAYHETYGLDTTVTNCSNNYGPYQFPEKLIPLTLINILRGKPLPVYGDGLQVRDWLHVADHCEAIALALDARARQARSTTSAAMRDDQHRGRAHAVRARRRGSRVARPELLAAFPASPAAGGRPRDGVDRARPRSAGARPPLCHRLSQGRSRARLRAHSRSGARPARDAGVVSVKSSLVGGAARQGLFRLDGKQLRATIAVHDAGQLDLCGAEYMMRDRGEKMVFSGMSARPVNGFTTKIKSSGSHHAE